MEDLRKRFGRLVAAHRRRAGISQRELSDRADISVEMVSKIEIGATGARFGNIEKLANALSVDPAEFFTTEVPSSTFKRRAYIDLTTRLASLSDDELEWIKGVIEAALKGRK